MRTDTQTIIKPGDYWLLTQNNSIVYLIRKSTGNLWLAKCFFLPQTAHWAAATACMKSTYVHSKYLKTKISRDEAIDQILDYYKSKIMYYFPE